MSYPTFTPTTTAEEVATALTKEIKGENVLITGTSINGLGFEAARVIAKHANLVIITGYNAERLRLSEEAIKNETPHANIRKLQVDLSSLASVRRAATEVISWSEHIHVTVHNAATSIAAFRLTEDNLEAQIATAHVGPFLFTKLILGKILATGSSSYTPRVVFLSSSIHAAGSGVDFEQLEHPVAEKHTALTAYFASKAAAVIDAIELSKRSKGKINAYSVSPGAIFTNISQKEESQADFKAAGMLTADGQPNMQAFNWKGIPEGAATIVIAAFDPRLDAVPGAYIDEAVVANEKIAPHSSDPANGAKLWEVTERIVGEKFTF
ncbi:NAD-P-binding protein [Mycena alexandri]|uniref:NAD-P-binding protein n=1 Tax=Mycena alexandri TaxID=1745969 RepID=A0AAD6X5B1_9AGAR|nr:NAD-P-binding protein [Mycena alexandri]